MNCLLPSHRPALVLAPMQDITDLPFMRVLARRGAPDWFVTEYFRVHPGSRLNRYILRSIVENQTDRPIFAQLIGRDLAAMRQTAIELSQFPLAGIDLNLGCPAPVVCRKDAGGGLLRDLEFLNRLIGTLREAIPGSFTIKTRLGYHSPDEFTQLLATFQAHAINGLTIHARTVQERYRTPVHPEPVAQAVESLTCPVIGNGNIVDIETAQSFINQTRVAGLMIGRGAIRNPWIFQQLVAAFEGRPYIRPTLRDVLLYVEELYEEIARESPKFDAKGHVQRMKRSIAYVSHGIHPDFEYQLRRANLPEEFHAICRAHLDSATPLPSQPPQGSKLFCGFEELRCSELRSIPKKNPSQ